MNTKSTEKRVINISKDDFDEIKKYCDDHTLNMPKAIAKAALEKFHENPNKNFLYNNFYKTNWVITEKAFLELDTYMKLYETYMKLGEEAAKNACWEFFQEMYKNTRIKENK